MRASMWLTNVLRRALEAIHRGSLTLILTLIDPRWIASSIHHQSISHFGIEEGTGPSVKN